MMDMQVAAHRVRAAGVTEIILRAVDGGILPLWNPGAHIEVHLPNGQRRQYSLCGMLDDVSAWTIAVRRDAQGRGGSRYLADELRVGQLVSVAGPRNSFRLQPAGRYVFIAAGIGITPLLPMIESCERDGRDWELRYIARDEAAAGFRERVEGPHTRMIYTANGSRPTAEFLLGRDEAPHARVYACGPAGLLSDLTKAAEGRAPGTLNTEWFAPRPSVASADARSRFDVELLRSGVTVAVAPTESIIAACARFGVTIPTSCGTGTCGSCETFIAGGVADHRDSVLGEQERASGTVMMPCVSGSRSDVLVLDA